MKAHELGKCLIAGALTLGIAPLSVQAQNLMGSMRFGRFSQPRSPYAMNPHMMNSYMMNPYMMNRYMSGGSSMSGNSYGQGSSPMNSGTSGALAGFGGQGYGGMGYGQRGTGQSAPIAPATLFGLPSENGRVQWPLGLQVLSPADETKALREQLELVLYFVATQAAEGQVNRTFIDFGLQAVHDFRQLLTPREGAMTAVTYTEAMRFLDRAERGLNKIRVLETSPGVAYP